MIPLLSSYGICEGIRRERQSFENLGMSMEFIWRGCFSEKCLYRDKCLGSNQILFSLWTVLERYRGTYKYNSDVSKISY